MSADNYGIIHHHGEGYGLSQFFASDDSGDAPDFSRPYFTSDSLREVANFADEEYFEYGWSYSLALREELFAGLDLKKQN